MRCVYLIRNLVNDKVYVGQTKNLASRKASHLYAMRRGDCRPLYSAIRKHGVENFTFEVLEECTDDVVNGREQHWVVYFDSFNLEKGYNLTSGGNQNFEHTPETIRKIREARARQNITEEHRQHISEGLLQSSQNLEVKAKRRAGQAKRQPCSDETKLRRSKSVKETYKKLENRVKHCSVCKQEGHYKQTCEVNS